MARRPPTSTSRCGTPPPERFGLGGRSVKLDPRIHAYRRDLADIGLAGQLFAPHYARPQPCRCTVDGTMIRSAGHDNASAVSQLAYGEGFAVLDVTAGWAWGRALHDDYVGYVPATALGTTEKATYRVTVPLALIFAHADIKSPVIATRSIGARLRAEAQGAFARTAEGFLSLRQLAPAGAVEPDPVAVAERLIGAPYRWGGRGAQGIDCSGLVQRALDFCGIAAPRDSDMQRAQLGEALGDDAPGQRGDLVFFPGHVGFMADADTLLHATAHWMQVVAEPLADVVDRLRPQHAAPILCRRRIAR